MSVHLVTEDNVEELITGNLTKEHKLLVVNVLDGLTHDEKRFFDGIARRIKITEVSEVALEHTPTKKSVRVVCELTVSEDMTQKMNIMHGGCTSSLVDVCSSLGLPVLDKLQGGPGRMGLSQSINMTFHAPAPLGVLIRVVNTTMSMGARSMSARTEIWDVTNGRLVATGIHLKMEPGSTVTHSLHTKL